jgi:hypothetical protein
MSKLRRREGSGFRRWSEGYRGAAPLPGNRRHFPGRYPGPAHLLWYNSNVDKQMTKEDWQAWNRRWDMMRQVELSETRATSREEKFRQYLGVMRLADGLGLLDKAQRIQSDHRSLPGT